MIVTADELRATGTLFLEKLLNTRDPLEEDDLLTKIRIILESSKAFTRGEVLANFQLLIEKIEIVKKEEKSVNLGKIQSVFALALT